MMAACWIKHDTVGKVAILCLATRYQLMGPNFLCIGAQKSGTTWLHRNLVPHPEIWLPPVKEIHYFDSLPAEKPDRVALRKKHARRTLTALRFQILNFGRQYGVGDLLWTIRYGAFRSRDEWYLSLFPKTTSSRAIGEITPGYATLSEASVNRVHRLLPGIKIVYLVRNPIERTWSTTVMMLDKHFGVQADDAPIDLILKVQKQVPFRKYSDYDLVIERWARYFGRDRIHVGFFDDLQQDPSGFLRSILAFLEVDSSPDRVPETVHNRVNHRPYTRVPESVLRSIAECQDEQIRRLNGYFANRWTEHWMRDAQTYLA